MRDKKTMSPLESRLFLESTEMAPTEPKTATKQDPRAWEALTPPLAEWILDAISSMGFARMTPVQAAVLPLFMTNKE
jgi:superfamily II DNA/RNA helicase